MVKIRVVIDGNRDPLHMKVPLNATVRNLKTRVHNVLSPPGGGACQHSVSYRRSQFQTFSVCFTSFSLLLQRPILFYLPVLLQLLF